METCCGYGYDPARESLASPSDFQGPAAAHRTPQEPRRFSGLRPLSPVEPIPGASAPPYKEKRTLSGAAAGVSEFVCVAALAEPRTHAAVRGVSHPDDAGREGRRSPCSGSGILTRFPFEEVRGGSRGQTDERTPERPGVQTELSCLLGSTDPCSTAVHMEPFSTSAFKVLT